MRVVIITDQFPPTFFGGMSQHAWHIAHFLSKDNIVNVIVPIGIPIPKDSKLNCILPILSIHNYTKDNYLVGRHVKIFNPDVVHVCTAGLAFPSVTTNFPVLLRVVGNDFLRPWCGGKNLLSRLLYYFPFKKAVEKSRQLDLIFKRNRIEKQLRNVDLIVANSDWTKRELFNLGIEEKLVTVIVGGYDPEVFHTTVDKTVDRNFLQLRLDVPILVTAANLVPKKGIGEVLCVLRDLKEQGIKFQYLVIGDGPLMSELQKYVKQNNLVNEVQFIGRVNQNSLGDYFRVADIYIQLSQDFKYFFNDIDVETMGRTYFEAGACGLPVIANDVGGVSSVVQQGINGYLLGRETNVKDIGELLKIMLIDGKLRTRLGETGAELAQNKFTWDQVGSQFETLMKNLRANKRGS
jgi:glycosyltransferase involved in cell wall biosynthesis